MRIVPEAMSAVPFTTGSPKTRKRSGMTTVSGSRPKQAGTAENATANSKGGKLEQLKTAEKGLGTDQADHIVSAVRIEIVRLGRDVDPLIREWRVFEQGIQTAK